MHSSIKLLISEAIQHSPSADNSQPWHINWHKNTLSIHYDTARVSHKTFPAESHAILLSIGACIENINQVADAHNIKLQYLIPEQFNPKDPVYFSCTFTEQNNNTYPVDQTLPLFHRHTNRMPFLAKAVPQETINTLNKTSLNLVKVKVLSENKLISQTGNIVRLASQIRFQTQEINEWLAKSFRFGKQVESTNDGLDVRTLDLPPGGTFFLRVISNWQRLNWLNKLGIYKFMAFIDSAPIKKSPAIIAIIGKQSFHDSLSAGQLMQRVWIDLNAQGIAAHPYYVISDQINRLHSDTVPHHLNQQAQQVHKETVDLFNLEKGEVLHILLRIGYPKKNVKRSRRLVLKEICNHLDPT